MSDATTLTPHPIKLRWFFGIFGAFLIFVVIAAYSSRMAEDHSDYDQQEAAKRYANLAELQAADQKTLTTADWVDQTKGTVRIPIDEAMVKEIDTLKTKPAQIGQAIPGTKPPPATPGKTGSTNAAPASAPPAPANK
jgi:hypothetical protein